MGFVVDTLLSLVLVFRTRQHIEHRSFFFSIIVSCLSFSRSLTCTLHSRLVSIYLVISIIAINTTSVISKQIPIKIFFCK